MRSLTRATLLGMLFLFSACDKDNLNTPSNPAMMSFETQIDDINGVSTRGIPITAVTEMKDMGVFAYNTGSSKWALAKATATSNYMHNQLVAQSEGKWSYAPVEYWPKTNTSIFAYAPYATANNGITVQNTYTGAPKIQYTVPSVCTNQPDLMVAARQTDMNSGVASLAMKHALACISFKVVGTNENITKIAVKGMSISGLLNLDNEGGVPVWDLDAATDTEYTSGIKNDLTANSTITDATTADGHLMMIPQTLGANAKVILTVDGVSKEISLSGKKWEAGKKTVYSINIRPTGSADILYFDTNDNNRLKVGKWDIEVSNLNIAFFKFGSVVGFTMIGGSDTWDDDGGDVKFNTTKGAYTTYSTIPVFEVSDYAAGISNVSDIQYHTGTNIKTHGKGDPCKLAGLTASEIQQMTEQEVNDYQSGWRLPTTNEYVDFVQAPTSWYGKDNQLSNANAPYYDRSPSGNRYGGWFPIPGNREDITGRGPRSTDPNGYLPAMGNRSADSSPVSATSIGYYWSSTSLSGTTARYLSIARTFLRPNNSGTVEYGFTIRCVRDTK